MQIHVLQLLQQRGLIHKESGLHQLKTLSIMKWKVQQRAETVEQLESFVRQEQDSSQFSKCRPLVIYEGTINL